MAKTKNATKDRFGREKLVSNWKGALGNIEAAITSEYCTPEVRMVFEKARIELLRINWVKQ